MFPGLDNVIKPIPQSGDDSAPTTPSTAGSGIIETTVLRHLDSLFRQQWNLGKNILLCWTLDGNVVQLLVAPHYFLGNFTASLTDCAPIDRLDALNGNFIRMLIAGSRYLSLADFQGAASRLELTPRKMLLPVALRLSPLLIQAVDKMVKRYSITYVKSRAVLLFDIVNFSLVTPFEQTSQLNSLSYSLNSAHNKLREKNIEINFSRTTTGDGYYVWHQEDSPRANLELFQFMLLVLADNAIAQRAARSGRTVGQIAPQIRTGFHIGSHFEFYQVEGLNPGMNSFIVGDVTIELARMLDIAGPDQVFIGDFDTQVPTSDRDSAYLITVNSERFVERATRQLQGVKLSGKLIKSMHCFLTGLNGSSGGRSIRRYRITDKHGRSRSAFNLRVNFRLSGNRAPIIIGLQDEACNRRVERRPGKCAAPSLLKAQMKPRKPAASPGGARRVLRKSLISAIDD